MAAGSHVRAQIRAAFVAQLTGLPTTAARVYAGRTRPLAADHSPSLLVYARDERVSPSATLGALDRVLEIVVEGRVVAADAPDETLDTIAAEVETALGVLPTLGGRVLAVDLAASRVAVQADGKNHIGSVTLEFAVLHRSREGAPTEFV